VTNQPFSQEFLDFMYAQEEVRIYRLLHKNSTDDDEMYRLLIYKMKEAQKKYEQYREKTSD
jgi:hypothetical protein